MQQAYQRLMRRCPAAEDMILLANDDIVFGADFIARALKTLLEMPFDPRRAYPEAAIMATNRDTASLISHINILFSRRMGPFNTFFSKLRSRLQAIEETFICRWMRQNAHQLAK